MLIEIRLFATLRENRGKIIYGHCNEGCTGMDLMNQSDISREQIAIFLINGRDGDLDRPLKENDVISVFPPVGGG